MAFRDQPIEIDYTGRGEDILAGFVLPVLSEAVEYDRVTSFFTTDSLIAIAEGLDQVWDRRGRMRLVLGLHDVPEDLAEAARRTEDPIGAVIAETRKRILEGITQVSDELARNRLTAVAWMMQDGLLEVRVAAPHSLTGQRPGIFHNKVFIFRDAEGDVVAAVGSPNETSAGLGSNFEHLTAFVSWEQPRYTEAQTGFFDSLWCDRQPGLSVRALDPDFAAEILAALPGRNRPQPPGRVAEGTIKVGQYLRAAARMPALAMVSGRHTALFPHQELAFVHALSRWPVRLMFCDEVGLGKTFEAGAALSYLLEYTGVARALILAPKAVTYQWQAELDEHFGVEAWVYDSARRAFLAPSGEVRVLAPSEAVLGSASPDVVIMSAQLARGTRRGESVFSGAKLPDVLVVDEAHAARVRPDLAGAERPTRMWRLLRDIVPSVPHVIFATATPMQVHWREYHALLELLGLPSAWRSPDNYRASLELVTLENQPTLGDAGLASRLILASVEAYRPARLLLAPEEKRLLDDLTDAAQGSDLAAATTVLADWPIARRLLAKVHPAQLLTIRNTRSSLEAIGYRFPIRELPPVALTVPDEVRAFYKKVDRYLSEAYFELERCLFPDKKFSVGFVKCGYQQRLASSLSACRLSLERRRDRIAAALADHSEFSAIEQDADEAIESDLMEEAWDGEPNAGAPSAADADGAVQAARIELEYLRDLTRMIDRILGERADPKIEKTNELLAMHLDAEDSVLVFSRYTDTLDAVVRGYRDAFGERLSPYAVYTGQTADIDWGLGPVRSTRREIRQALDAGKIRIVFCSDAASEGLNLQAARVLLNVDVPWNPARLEQRIGRIARLGQRASTVTIYNLWYPDSVEAKIYKRLLERADLYQVAVGEFPEVVGAAIRAEVASRFGGPRSTTDAVAELVRLRNDVQVEALRSLWRKGGSAVTMTQGFRGALSNLATRAAEEAGASTRCEGPVVRISEGDKSLAFTIEPGSDAVLSLRHSALDWLADRAVAESAPAVRVLSSEDGPAFFEVNGTPIDPLGFPKMIAALAGLEGTAESLDLPTLKADHSGQAVCDWLPRPSHLTIPAELQLRTPEPPQSLLHALDSVSIDGTGESTCA